MWLHDYVITSMTILALYNMQLLYYYCIYCLESDNRQDGELKDADVEVAQVMSTIIINPLHM